MALPDAADSTTLTAKRTAIGLLLLSEVAAMATWFATTASIGAIRTHWTLSPFQEALLTNSVQAGLRRRHAGQRAARAGRPVRPAPAVLRLRHGGGPRQLGDAGFRADIAGGAAAALRDRGLHGRCLPGRHEDRRDLGGGRPGPADRPAGGRAHPRLGAAAPRGGVRPARLAPAGARRGAGRAPVGRPDPLRAASGRSGRRRRPCAWRTPWRRGATAACAWPISAISATCGSSTRCGPGSAPSWRRASGTATATPLRSRRNSPPSRWSPPALSAPCWAAGRPTGSDAPSSPEPRCSPAAAAPSRSASCSAGPPGRSCR